jgi:putative flavoprotein involved in K+ transport
MSLETQPLDVLIIGAGQAGLAMGYHLRQTPYRFQLVEVDTRVGDSWRKRYDSLMLFTPRSYSALPGLPLDGDADGYASRDEFAAYLQAYAQHFQLPIRLNTPISRLEQVEGGFCASLADNTRIESRAVVLATGAFQKPAVPAIAAHFSADVAQFTAANYRNPAQVPPGSVVVVGDGATGRDIANELSISHKVFLATGKSRRLLPDRVLGRSVWWWFDRLGLLAASADSHIGQFIRKRDPFPGRGKDFTYLRRKGVQIVGRLSQVDGKKAIFVTGDMIETDAVVWATGYTDNSDWVAIPEIKDMRGQFIHQQGTTAVPNLYFIGRPWQRSRGSALITGVGADAAFVAARIAQSLDRGQLSNHRVGVVVDD